jgi:hypothetical protein
MNAQKTKRPRIKANLPTHTSTVEFRIFKAINELGKGLTKFELKMLLIKNDLNALNL